MNAWRSSFLVAQLNIVEDFCGVTSELALVIYNRVQLRSCTEEVCLYMVGTIAKLQAHII